MTYNYKITTIIGICFLILFYLIMIIGISLQSNLLGSKLIGMWSLVCLFLGLLLIIPGLNNFFKNYGSEDGGVK